MKIPVQWEFDKWMIPEEAPNIEVRNLDIVHSNSVISGNSMRNPSEAWARSGIEFPGSY